MFDLKYFNNIKKEQEAFESSQNRLHNAYNRKNAPSKHDEKRNLFVAQILLQTQSNIAQSLLSKLSDNIAVNPYHFIRDMK